MMHDEFTEILNAVATRIVALEAAAEKILAAPNGKLLSGYVEAILPGNALAWCKVQGEYMVTDGGMPLTTVADFSKLRVMFASFLDTQRHGLFDQTVDAFVDHVISTGEDLHGMIMGADWIEKHPNPDGTPEHKVFWSLVLSGWRQAVAQKDAA